MSNDKILTSISSFPFHFIVIPFLFIPIFFHGSYISQDEEGKVLAKSMMSNKTKKLYDKMQFGIAKKSEKVQKLESRRMEIEKEATRGNKGKKGTSKKQKVKK